MMTSRFRNWRREEKQWMKGHVESWEGMAEIQENNLTKFQDACFEQLKSSLSANNLELTEIKIEAMNWHRKEYIIYGILPNSNSQIYIYEDGVQLEEELNHEKWDFKTPQEMIADFVASAIKLELRTRKLKSNKNMLLSAQPRRPFLL